MWGRLCAVVFTVRVCAVVDHGGNICCCAMSSCVGSSVCCVCSLNDRGVEGVVRGSVCVLLYQGVDSACSML